MLPLQLIGLSNERRILIRRLDEKPRPLNVAKSVATLRELSLCQPQDRSLRKHVVVSPPFAIGARGPHPPHTIPESAQLYLSSQTRGVFTFLPLEFRLFGALKRRINVAGQLHIIK